MWIFQWSQKPQSRGSTRDVWAIEYLINPSKMQQQKKESLVVFFCFRGTQLSKFPGLWYSGIIRQHGDLIGFQLCKCLFWLKHPQASDQPRHPSLNAFYYSCIHIYDEVEYSSCIDVSLIYLMSVYNIVSTIFHFICYALHFGFAFLMHLPTEWEF